MKKNGVIVSGTYDIIINNKVYNPSIDSNIKIGDVIYEVDNKEIKCSKDFINTISYDNDNNLDLKIKRNNKIVFETIKYQKDDYVFKTGLYIKDKILGVGTLTYYDPETKNYGALGHEIIDSNTGNIIDINNGTIFDSEVTSITRSSKGDPGEKNAVLYSDKIDGNIYENTSKGIFGNYTNAINDSKLYKVADIEDIKLGSAKILTVLEGNEVKEFDINILSIKKTKDKLKNIEIEITDKKLLDKTNGVVQGMSGSPIIQGEYIIGAVTHVVVEDPHRGYGILIKNMLEEAEN
jgi:stage IV sporulation protein B